MISNKKFEVEYRSNGRTQKMSLSANSKSSSGFAKRKSGGTITKKGEAKAVINEREIEAKGLARFFGSNKGSVKLPALVATIRQLAVMTHAGISIHDSIKEVARQAEDPKLKNIFLSINDDLNAGLSMTEAVEKFRPQLGDVVVAMVSLGEKTGNMAEAMQKLGQMLDDIWENKRKFKKAMRYPITILVALAIAFTILIMYVVPKFREIFEELGAELPLPTRILLGIEYALSNYGLLVLMTILGIIFGTKYLYKNNLDFKKRWDHYILKVYLLGKIEFYSTMSRFMLIFTELVRSGIPIADALDTAVLMVDNEELKMKLGSIKVAIQQGVSLTDAFRDTEIFLPMLIQMISAGEQSGALEKMLGNVADFYKEKFDDIIDNISSYVEPILLLAMAGMVLLLALGIFMPMWDLGKAVKS